MARRMRQRDRAKGLYDVGELSAEEFDPEKERSLHISRGEHAADFSPSRLSKRWILIGAGALLILITLAVYFSFWSRARGGETGVLATRAPNGPVVAVKAPVSPEVGAKAVFQELKSASISVPTKFNLKSGPGKIELLRCHMDECSWSQVQSVTPIRADASSILVQVVARSGKSSHDPNNNPQYPESYSTSLRIDWRTRRRGQSLT